MRKIVVIVLALLLALTVAIAAAEEKRWVTSDGAVLKSEASVSSNDVANLPIGSELTVIETGGRWVKVKTANGKVGWIYAGRIADAPPSSEVKGEAGVFGGAVQGSQIQTAKSDSARSIRGLSPETTQYAKMRGTPESYKKELDRVLARKVSAKEIKAFLREGKIGEYAR